MKNDNFSKQERNLLKKLKTVGGKNARMLSELVNLNDAAGKHHQALVYISQLIPLLRNKEKRVERLFRAGQLAELIGDFAGAEAFYRQAESFEPQNILMRYFIHNNLGYSLNMQKHFKEAAPFLLTAIRNIPSIANAYKNLGISYEGSGEYTKAAKMFVKATEVNPGDPRALCHLEGMLDKHKEVVSAIPGIKAKIAKCQQAVYRGTANA